MPGIRFNLMVQRTVPLGIHDLIRLGESLAHGLENCGPGLQIMQAQPAEFRAALANLRESEAACARLRSEKAAARKWMHAADEALTDWLAKARLAVMLARGVQWSQAWLEAGFTHQGTGVPKAVDSRIELARRVIVFFAHNPQFGVAHANVTASHGRKLYDDIVSARQVRRQLITECSHAKTARDAAERKLRQKMRQVTVLLSVRAKATESRGHAFRLHQPRVRSSKRRALAAIPAAPIPLLSPA
jgi:hypothetical protein